MSQTFVGSYHIKLLISIYVSIDKFKKDCIQSDFTKQ